MNYFNIFKFNSEKVSCLPYCPSCGKEILTDGDYCSSCGNKITILNSKINQEKSGALPKQEITITKSKSIASKFQISLGVVILLIGIGIEDYQNTFFGILLFIIGFVGLKNKSKTIDQLLTIVSLIIFVVAIISLLK